MIREQLIHQQMYEPAFRWRGHSHVSRIESFSDTVFAVALTLTIVSSVSPKSFPELEVVIAGFVAFAVIFAFLIQLWYFHFIFFRRYNLQDHATLYLNATLLFVILFYTFPLKFLFTLVVAIYVGWVPGMAQALTVITDQQWPQLMAMYGVGFFLVNSLFALLYMHANRMRQFLELNAAEIWITRYSIAMFFTISVVGLLSIAVVYGTRSPFLSGLTYSLTGIISAVGRSVLRRKLAAFNAA